MKIKKIIRPLLRKKIDKLKKNNFSNNTFFCYYIQIKSVGHYIFKKSAVLRNPFFKFRNSSREIFILLQKIWFYLMSSSSYKVSFCMMIISVYSLIAICN